MLAIPFRLGRWIVLAAWVLGLAAPVQADRCGTGALLNGTAHPPLAGAVVASAANSLQSAHFVVHWGNSFNAADPDWASRTVPTGQSGATSAPGFVIDTLTLFETAYNTEITAKGFSFPTNKLAADGLLHLYVMGTGAVDPAGRTTLTSGSLGVTGISAVYVYISLQSDYSPYWTPPTPLTDPTDATSGNNLYLEVVAAHEFFHAIQSGYMAFNSFDIGSSWWMEATATWMENEVFPTNNDYLSFIKEVTLYPQRALAAFNGYHEYGAVAFVQRLAARFDGANGGSTVKTIFNAWQSQPASSWETVVGQVLTADGTTLPDAVADFWFSMLQPAAATPAYPDGNSSRMTPISPSDLTFSGGANLNLCGPDRFGVRMAKYTGSGTVSLAGSGGSGAWYGYVPGQTVAPSPSGTGTILSWTGGTGYLLGLGLATDISSRSGGYDGTRYNEKSGPCIAFAAGANAQPPVTACTATCGTAATTTRSSTVSGGSSTGCMIHLLEGF